MMFGIIIVVVLVVSEQLVIYIRIGSRSVFDGEMPDGEQPSKQHCGRNESWNGFHCLPVRTATGWRQGNSSRWICGALLSALAARMRHDNLGRMASPLAPARAWVDRIHLNRSTRCHRQGRPILWKRRRWIAGMVMRFANVFFHFARNPVEAIAGTAEWRRWEEDWFRRLHRPDFSAGTGPDGSFWMDVLPGESLAQYLTRGALQPAHLVAAGAELRRAHELYCAYHGGGWSHGDSHTGNFIFDVATGRARLVDFEVRHLRVLSERERHADDLLVMLQDVCGRCSADAWLPMAGAFLNGYGRPEIAALLPGKLHVPGGIPRLWWAVRTTWMPRAVLESRVAALRERLCGAGRFE